jgi:hypothetical protein
MTPIQNAVVVSLTNNRSACIKILISLMIGNHFLLKQLLEADLQLLVQRHNSGLPG